MNHKYAREEVLELLQVALDAPNATEGEDFITGFDEALEFAIKLLKES